nr:hypothetical protein [Orientia tsutsugamushi]
MEVRNGAKICVIWQAIIAKLLIITVAIMTQYFYNFIGNIIPPEWEKANWRQWKSIKQDTSKQLLSFIVFRLHIYYNKDIDELQESYYFLKMS